MYPLNLNDTWALKHIALTSAHTKIGRQTSSKTAPGKRNGFFYSRVLSPHLLEVWEEGGKDAKSSNGMSINGERSYSEGQESELFELKSDDIVEFGIDIVGEDNKTIIHHKVAARAEQHQAQQQLQQHYPGGINGLGGLVGGAGEAQSFPPFAAQRRAQLAQQGLGSMGGMRPPGKTGLSFDVVLSRLQGEVQKSRETGAELSSLTSAMTEIHDMLSGGVPDNLPPFPAHLPPVKPPQESQPPPLQLPMVALALTPLGTPSFPEQPSAGGAVSASVVVDLQSQIRDTQSSLEPHLDKVRAIEGVLAEQEAMKREVSMLREMMEERRREMEAIMQMRGVLRARCWAMDMSLRGWRRRMRSNWRRREGNMDTFRARRSPLAALTSTSSPPHPSSKTHPPPRPLRIRRRARPSAKAHAASEHHPHAHELAGGPAQQRAGHDCSAGGQGGELGGDVAGCGGESAESGGADHDEYCHGDSLACALAGECGGAEKDKETPKDLANIKEFQSLTAFLAEWKSSVKGQWGSVQSEWNAERERLARVREERERELVERQQLLQQQQSESERGRETKTRPPRSQLVGQQEEVRAFMDQQAKVHAQLSAEGVLNANGDALKSSHGLVTPPSPRSQSSDSGGRYRRRRRISSAANVNANGRGRSRSREREDDADTDATLASSTEDNDKMGEYDEDHHPAKHGSIARALGVVVGAATSVAAYPVEAALGAGGAGKIGLAMLAHSVSSSVRSLDGASSASGSSGSGSSFSVGSSVGSAGGGGSPLKSQLGPTRFNKGDEHDSGMTSKDGSKEPQSESQNHTNMASLLSSLDLTRRMVLMHFLDLGVFFFLGVGVFCCDVLCTAQQSPGSMGGMHLPRKTGLSSDVILSRLQGKVEKSRETGAEMSLLTSAMMEIHDTLSGGVPNNLPPFPAHLPPVKPPQESQPPALTTSNGASAPFTSPEQLSTGGFISASVVVDLQSQIRDTQSSLESHLVKVRAVDGVLRSRRG
ncbi:hypothetical protein CVT26_002486 [Gymnopilus dilepis]|uniref:FHA domain-containing protein n=1 Tax=Gymnopilus dilepis TaxID=231916 RepID=A0A409Y3Q3_9AGAR|nr:hypothetical protein CVT26_002486 [Gymnopilus dilepis]